jgi:N-acetylmuramoyl-L-alanine amidase
LFLARKASVVVEIGFHTNPADAALLQSEAFQQKSAEAVAKAWRRYVNGERCG